MRPPGSDRRRRGCRRRRRRAPARPPARAGTPRRSRSRARRSARMDRGNAPASGYAAPMSGPDKNLAAKSKQPMPGFVKKALEKRNLVDAYRARPAYQQNDYLFWIAEAKLQPMKDKRL